MINYNSQRNQEWENAIKCRLRFQYPVETKYWGGIRWILDEDGYCQMSSDQSLLEICSNYLQQCHPAWDDIFQFRTDKSLSLSEVTLPPVDPKERWNLYLRLLKVMRKWRLFLEERLISLLLLGGLCVHHGVFFSPAYWIVSRKWDTFQGAFCCGRGFASGARVTRHSTESPAQLSNQNSGYLLHTTLPETNSSPMKIPIEILVNTIQNGGFSNQLC